MHADSVLIEDLSVAAYTIPTETPEADGTYEWESTTIVIVEVSGGGEEGLGYTYADTATAQLIEDKLKPVVIDRDAMSVQGHVVGHAAVFLRYSAFDRAASDQQKDAGCCSLSGNSY